MEPSVITAGDTVTWTRVDPEYTIEEYTLTYIGLTTSHGFSIIASAGAGYTFSVSLAPSLTTSLTSGVYHWWAFMAKGSGTALERYQVDEGTIEIKPNWASLVAAGVDIRSHVKRTLDAIEAAIEGRATAAQKSYTIAGRAIEFWSLTDLFELRDRYRAEYAGELGRITRLLVRFTEPS
jgi:hypothetical protein